MLPLLLVINLGYWEETIQTLALIMFSTLTCVVVGVPLGIAAAHRPWLYSGIRPVLVVLRLDALLQHRSLMRQLVATSESSRPELEHLHRATLRQPLHDMKHEK